MGRLEGCTGGESACFVSGVAGCCFCRRRGEERQVSWRARRGLLLEANESSSSPPSFFFLPSLFYVSQELLLFCPRPRRPGRLHRVPLGVVPISRSRWFVSLLLLLVLFDERVASLLELTIFPFLSASFDSDDTYLTSQDYLPHINKYKIKASQSIEDWEKQGWIRKQDPRGWCQVSLAAFLLFFHSLFTRGTIGNSFRNDSNSPSTWTSKSKPTRPSSPLPSPFIPRSGTSASSSVDERKTTLVRSQDGLDVLVLEEGSRTL